MTATNESNLGLYLGWTYGEDNWNTGMDANMSILGAISQLYVKSRSTSVKPVSPTNGDRYYVPVGATGDWSAYEKHIAIYSAFHAGWLYVPAKAGMEFRVEDESNASFYYNGTALVTSTSLSGYLTAASTYTATGDVTFQAPPKFSGSHTVDTTELATIGDVNTKIAAVDYSTFVRTTGDQAVAGIKTFASSPVIPDAANANQPVAKGQMDTAIAAVTGANVGTGADVFKDKSGSNIRLRSIKAGSNVTVTENADEILIEATGGGVDETLDYNWTGEHTWDISGGKSFIVSDDPTLVAPTNIMGIADHVASMPTGTGVYINALNPTGGNSSSYSVLLNDDGSVERYFNIGNAVDDVADATTLSAVGVSSRTIVVDSLNINSEMKVDISGGKSFIVSDDPTLTVPNRLFCLLDHDQLVSITSVDTLLQSYNQIGGSNALIHSSADDDGRAIIALNIVNGNGTAGDNILVEPDGSSSKSVNADKIQLTGVQQHSGYKSGTLASPPAGMLVGEVWADTTDSATHPVYRISTVAT